MCMAQDGSSAVAHQNAGPGFYIGLRNRILNYVERSLDFVPVFQSLIGVHYSELKERLGRIIGAALRRAFDYKILAQIGSEIGPGRDRT